MKSCANAVAKLRQTQSTLSDAGEPFPVDCHRRELPGRACLRFSQLLDEPFASARGRAGLHAWQHYGIAKAVPSRVLFVSRTHAPPRRRREYSIEMTYAADNQRAPRVPSLSFRPDRLLLAFLPSIHPMTSCYFFHEWFLSRLGQRASCKNEVLLSV